MKGFLIKTAILLIVCFSKSFAGFFIQAGMLAGKAKLNIQEEYREPLQIVRISNEANINSGGFAIGLGYEFQTESAFKFSYGFTISGKGGETNYSVSIFPDNNIYGTQVRGVGIFDLYIKPGFQVSSTTQIYANIGLTAIGTTFVRKGRGEYKENRSIAGTGAIFGLGIETKTSERLSVYGALNSRAVQGSDDISFNYSEEFEAKDISAEIGIRYYF